MWDYYLHYLSDFESYHLVYVDEYGCDNPVGFRRTGWAPRGTSPVQITQFHRDRRYQILQYFWETVSPPTLIHCFPNPKCQITLDLIKEGMDIITFLCFTNIILYIQHAQMCMGIQVLLKIGILADPSRGNANNSSSGGACVSDLLLELCVWSFLVILDIEIPCFDD